MNTYTFHATLPIYVLIYRGIHSVYYLRIIIGRRVTILRILIIKVRKRIKQCNPGILRKPGFAIQYFKRRSCFYKIISEYVSSEYPKTKKYRYERGIIERDHLTKCTKILIWRRGEPPNIKRPHYF